MNDPRKSPTHTPTPFARRADSKDARLAALRRRFEAATPPTPKPARPRLPRMHTDWRGRAAFALGLIFVLAILLNL